MIIFLTIWAPERKLIFNVQTLIRPASLRINFPIMLTFAGSGAHILDDLGCEHKSPAVSFHLTANYHEYQLS